MAKKGAASAVRCSTLGSIVALLAATTANTFYSAVVKRGHMARDTQEVGKRVPLLHDDGQAPCTGFDGRLVLVSSVGDGLHFAIGGHGLNKGVIRHPPG